MESNKIAISLSPSELAYYPGGDVSGSVALELNKVGEVKTFVIKLLGKSMCRFKGRASKYGRRNESRWQVYTNEDIEFEDEIYLAGTYSKCDKVNLSQGKHEFGFNFQLPPNLPSSFECKFGYISYTLNVQFGEDIISRTIIVNEILDNIPSKNIRSSVEESFGDHGFLRKFGGKLTIKGHTNKYCYCPGDAIILTINVENGAPIKMRVFQIQLMQTTKFKTKERTKKIEKVVTKVALKDCNIPKRDCLILEYQPFIVPDIPASISNCKTMTVEYDVRIEVGLFCGNVHSVKIPIIVASSPRHPYASQMVEHGALEVQRSLFQTNHLVGRSQNTEFRGYMDLTPPCYSTLIEQGVINPLHISQVKAINNCTSEEYNRTANLNHVD